MKGRITIIGGGLAGVEAAAQAVRREIAVDLYEMRPTSMSDAHVSGFLGEMVCSNSLGSLELTSASGLLKEELKTLGSFFLAQAEPFRVPSGNSLAVDRLRLAEHITRTLESMPQVTIHRQECVGLPQGENPVIIASGPLTSPGLAEAISQFTMRKNLFFFDATCPLVRADSIDFSKMFAASRYNKGAADFFNIPLSADQYEAFITCLLEAEMVEMKEFEKQIYFDACLPLEEIARRGRQSLAYGPLKPVGLVDPRTGQMPHAVVQLRADDVHGEYFQLVGFQTRLKYPEQKRIFRMLPGLENAEIERFGRMHRNTYINAPLILTSRYQSKTKKEIFFAGQISGVEGYVESLASGLIASLAAVSMAGGGTLEEPPDTTAIGSLSRYIANSNWKDFKPSKFSFGLLPDRGISHKNKKLKKQLKAERALNDLTQWIKRNGI